MTSVLHDATADLVPTLTQDGNSDGVFGRRFNSTGGPIGGEFAVNTYTTDSQLFPAVAVDSKGNLAVVWYSGGQDGDGHGVFGRRFNSTGAPLGGEFAVNTHTTGSQFNPAVALDKKGNLVAVWQGAGQDGDGFGVFGRRFNPTGAPLGGEFPVNTHTTGNQVNPSVAVDKKGNLVVAWNSLGQDGDNYGVFGHRFDPTGAPLGGEFPMNTYTTGSQSIPAVALDKKGNLVVVWNSVGQDGDGFGVFGRRFDPTGAPLGGEFPVNTNTTSSQFFPAVALDKKGNLAVVWQSYLQDGDKFGVFGRRFDATGTPLGGEFSVNTYTTGSQSIPAVASDKKGNLAVVWMSDGQDGSNYGVVGRRLNATGAPLGGEFSINTYTTGSQYNPSIAVDGKGNFVVAWTGG